MQKQLKPCPFCGGNNLVNASSFTGYVYCKDCGAKGPPSKDLELAVLAWNAASLEWTRTPPTKAGFYFYRNLFGCVQMVKFLPQIMTLADRNGEWAGPIPEPMERR